MSSKFYDEIFNATIKRAKDLVKRDIAANEPIMDRQKAVTHVVLFYLEYVDIAKQFNLCYDHMLQPEKLEILRFILEGTLGRALELKEELCKLECKDIHFLDNKVSDFGIEYARLPIPRYFKEEKTDEDKEKDNLVETALRKKELSEVTLQENEESFSKTEILNKYIPIIQTHIRAFQQRNNFVKSKINHLQMEKKIPGPAVDEINISELEKAAICIQSAWRGFYTRRIIKFEKENEMQLLRMFLPTSYKQDNYAIEIEKKVQDIHKERQDLRLVHKQNLKNAIEEIHKHLMRDIIPYMKENWTDAIRKYIHEYFLKHKEFPTYPTEEEGGSLVFLPEEGFEIPVIESTEPESNVLLNNKNNTSKDEKKKDKQKPDEDVFLGYILQPSNYITDITLNLNKYDIWLQERKTTLTKPEFEFNSVEYWAPLYPGKDEYDGIDTDVIKNKLLYEYTLQARKEIDKEMREELQKLYDAFETDLGTTVEIEKSKEQKEKTKEDKPKEKSAKSKKGKKKDLTADRTNESLVQELVDNNVIKRYPKVFFSDIIDEINYSAYAKDISNPYQDQQTYEPDPSTSDVKREIIECGILPMLSESIHTKGPYTKSVLFAGPRGCGKSMFVHALCNEMGATLFDLTAENLVGTYPEKLNLTMFVHLIEKVGNLLQPTVICVEEAEIMFLDKAVDEAIALYNLGKEIGKFVKGIKPEQRIFLIGTTADPFDYNPKALGQTFQKVFYLSPPDYNFRRILWLNAIRANDGIIPPSFDLSTLSYVSKGYTFPDIQAISKYVLNERRIMYQDKAKLVIEEFTLRLCEYMPIYEEECKAFKDWLLKLPLGKKRKKMLEEEKEELENQKGQKKKGKK